ncbi:hypothetical protein Scep_015564 [Stephania cephalantha]|uniref:Uncharacterized protein n=1 Tax=Stephania cephalantha TaxID=152367 RepID=A0AAP0J3G4_9MAGN
MGERLFLTYHMLVHYMFLILYQVAVRVQHTLSFQLYFVREQCLSKLGRPE